MPLQWHFTSAQSFFSSLQTQLRCLRQTKILCVLFPLPRAPLPQLLCAGSFSPSGVSSDVTSSQGPDLTYDRPTVFPPEHLAHLWLASYLQSGLLLSCMGACSCLSCSPLNPGVLHLNFTSQEMIRHHSRWASLVAE